MVKLLAILFATINIERVFVIDGVPPTLYAVALDIEAENETGAIRIPIKKLPYEFTQVGAESETIGMGTVGSDHVRMSLDNMWNFGYVGEFYLGSGEPQLIRVLFDTGSANSWIISK